jgi:hypothetical protein
MVSPCPVKVRRSALGMPQIVARRGSPTQEARLTPPFGPSAALPPNANEPVTSERRCPALIVRPANTCSGSGVAFLLTVSNRWAQNCVMVNATSACPIPLFSAFQSIFASRPAVEHTTVLDAPGRVVDAADRELARLQRDHAVVSLVESGPETRCL